LRLLANLVYVKLAFVKDALAKPLVILRVDKQIIVKNPITLVVTTVQQGRMQRLGDFIDTNVVSP
jgi:hypothetical protein